MPRQRGIQIAYEILSKTELSKLQEKQTLLTGSGILDSFLLTPNSHPTATNNPLTDQKNELAISSLVKEKLVFTAKNMNEYASIALHSRYLPKILSTAVVGDGASYNNIIINEMLHVAMLNTYLCP